MDMGISLIAHGLLAVFLIIELGLTAYLVTVSHGIFGSHSSRYNFMLFNTVWSIVIILYTGLAQRIFSRLYHSLVGLALLVVTALFWFAGSIAIAADIPTNCHSSGNCRVAQAAVAFGFFIWAIFTGLAVLEGLGSRGGARADRK